MPAYSHVTRAAPILTNIHSSYAVIWTQVTTISDVSVAVAAKPEVEIWRRPKNQLFDAAVSYSLLQTVFHTELYSPCNGSTV